MPIAKHLWRDAWLVDAIQKKVVKVKPEGSVTYQGVTYPYGESCRLRIEHDGARAIVSLLRIVALAQIPNPLGLPDVRTIEPGGPNAQSPENLCWSGQGATPPFTAHDLLAIRCAPRTRSNEDLAYPFGLRSVDAKRIRNYPWKAFVQ